MEELIGLANYKEYGYNLVPVKKLFIILTSPQKGRPYWAKITQESQMNDKFNTENEDNMEKEKKSKIKKILVNLIIFILLIILTFSLVLKDQDVSQIFSIVAKVKKQYILLAVVAMSIYILGEAVNITRILKELGEKSKFISNIRYTLIGFFFSAITPAASGGQPMEIYYMHKDDISVAHSTLALLMQLCSLQIVTITVGIASAVIHFDVLKSGLIYLLILGILLNSSALMLLIIAIFSKRLSKGLIKFVVKLLKFFRIPNVEKKQEKLEKELESYQTSARYIKEHKILMLKTVLTTVVQMIAYYSVPYWVYLAFGLTEHGIFEILTLQAVLYATVSGIPSPGSVGVSEGGFLGIFRNTFPEAVISSAMLLTRVANFYLFIIISAVIVMISTFREKRIERKQMKENTEAVESAGIVENEETIKNTETVKNTETIENAKLTEITETTADKEEKE